MKIQILKSHKSKLKKNLLNHNLRILKMIQKLKL